MSRGLVPALSTIRLFAADEEELQEAVESALQEGGIHYARERTLGRSDRIDFLCEGGVGVEVKIQGSLSDLTRQLFRYAEHPGIERLVLVTTKARLRRLPRTVLGKPLEVVYLCPL